MQEDLQQKAIALSFQTAALTIDVLKAAIQKYLDMQGETKHGQQTLRELLRHNAEISNIEITDGNIKSFERTAKEYGLDFSLKKDGSVEPPRYLVFFKGRDLEAINAAFIKFSNIQMGLEKPSLREQLYQLRDHTLQRVQQMIRDRVRLPEL